MCKQIGYTSELCRRSMAHSRALIDLLEWFSLSSIYHFRFICFVQNLSPFFIRRLSIFVFQPYSLRLWNRKSKPDFRFRLPIIPRLVIEPTFTVHLLFLFTFSLCLFTFRAYPTCNFLWGYLGIFFYFLVLKFPESRLLWYFQIPLPNLDFWTWLGWNVLTFRLSSFSSFFTGFCPFLLMLFEEMFQVDFWAQLISTVTRSDCLFCLESFF